ncbi:putative dTDP-4-dehydrorhamnose reductase [Candidatus Moduliflexus flocculans]|uniref:dTDP-4-dehydrorhamnose reductase n=1 Tax=Candidatus Moduliflexus flocculans TaxID=1499966 RepID=A0A081BMU3_9BACT|nr:putative dTDP-4-dehydrorhamnose reductase [Candidatus Moduliflexus flocculans]
MAEYSPFMVFGASGLIGSSIWGKLPQSRRVGTFHKFPKNDLLPIDIQDKHAIRQFIQRVKPSIIWHAAALANVDWCETHRDECWAVNVSGTQNIVLAAKEVGAKLIFFSSDYIFDGKHGPYDEDSLPSPINLYGEAKLEAEQVICRELTDYLIIRVTVVYGKESQNKNFVIRLLQTLQQGKIIQVPIDQVGNPTYVDNLADAALELVCRKQRGIFNVAGSERMTRYAFACLAAQIFGLDSTKIIPVSTDELHQNARRPLNAGMNVEKTQSIITTPLLSPQEGLQRLKLQDHQII